MPLNQQRLAKWTEGWAATSLCLPAIGVVAVYGFGEGIWMRCIALVGMAYLGLTALEKLKKEDFAYRKLGWTIALSYFALVLSIVAYTFESMALATVLGFPELVGLALSTWGLIDAVKYGNTRGNPNETVAMAPTKDQQ